MKTRGVIPVLLAYPAAAAVGAAIVALGFAATGMIAQAMNGLAHEIAAGLWITLPAFIYAFLVFAAGLVVIGAPVWLVMIRFGRTARRDAILAGAVLSVLPVLAFVLADGPSVLIWEPWAFGLSMAAPGAAAGWTLHRIAYGKAPA